MVYISPSQRLEEIKVNGSCLSLGKVKERIIIYKATILPDNKCAEEIAKVSGVGENTKRIQGNSWSIMDSMSPIDTRTDHW